MDEVKYFEKALRLAQSVKGNTSPNPAVGAVIVNNGVIAGCGATQKAGKEHAEAVAIKQASANVKGADMYVTLEPCVDYPGKKTASCSQAIIDSGIKRLFIGMKDPNPNVNGNGIELLKKAGVEIVILNTFRKELIILNEDYIKYVQTGRPFVYAKYAMTLDGNIANIEGDSHWVSNEFSLKWVHAFRNRVDVIMIGIGAVLKDNPQLNVRLTPKIKDPLRIIIDPHGKTPSYFNVMSDNNETVFIIGKDNSLNKFKNICKKNNKRFIEFEAPFNFNVVFKKLSDLFDVESIFIEGGGRLFYSCLNDGVIDKLMVFVSPKILGGKGIQPFEGATKNKMSDALKLTDISVENIEGDILIQGYL